MYPLLFFQVIYGYSQTPFYLGNSSGVELEYWPGGFLRCPGENNLSFKDDFDGITINSTEWRTHTGNIPPLDRIDPNRCDNNDWTNSATFRDENVVVEEGLLKLYLKKESNTYTGVVGSYGDDPCGTPLNCSDLVACEDFSIFSRYTGAAVHRNTNIGYGRFKIRAKIPDQNGTWPSFWFWHHDEIDVFEFFGNPDELVLGYHKEGLGGENEHFNFGNIFYTQFNTYEMEYTPWTVKYYFNDQLLHEIKRYDIDNCECGNYLKPGIYYINKWFPRTGTSFQNEHRWFGSIFWMGAWNNLDDEFVEDVYEIDYCEVYERTPVCHNPSFCGITGESDICYSFSNSEENYHTYSLNTSDANFTEITWSSSYGINIVEEDSHEITIYPSNSGDQWVKATIHYPTSEPTEIVHQIGVAWTENIDPPAYLHGRSTVDVINGICTYSITHPYYAAGWTNNGVLFHWEVTPMCDGLEPYTVTTTTPTITGLHCRYVFVKLYVQNACATSEAFSAFIIEPDEVYDCKCKLGLINGPGCNYNGGYNLNINPNPSNNYINIEIENFDQGLENSQIVLIDVYGNTVKSLTSDSEYLSNIDISNLQNGLYNVMLINIDGAIILQKQIVKNDNY